MKKISLLLTLVFVLVFNMVACKQTVTNEDAERIGNERKLDTANVVDETLEGVKDNLENVGDKLENNVEDMFDSNHMYEDAFVPVDVSAGGWNIIIKDVMVEDSLENFDVVLGYTDATTNKFVKEATSGHVYVLLKMNISKHDSKETLSWDKFTLTDNHGNEYKRMDDTFIKDLGLVRMSGIDLNFGANEGWIAFEVKEDAENLTLKYEFENETLAYTIGE
jgi:hypothetical protein